MLPRSAAQYSYARMTRMLTVLLFIASFLVTMPVARADGDGTDVDVPAFLRSLDPDVREYMAHMMTLSNPFFEGRAPGTNGNRVAADYVEFWFRKNGLEPAFPEENSETDSPWTTYRQPFTVGGGKVAEHEACSVALGETEIAFKPGVDFNATGMGNGNAQAPLSFVGYGIKEGPDGYTSFGNIDLTGRIAVVMRFEPSDDEGLSQWNKGKKGWSRRANLRTKILETAAKGAAGIILVSPPGTHDSRTSEILTPQTSSWGRPVGVPVIHMSIPAVEKLFAMTTDRTLVELKAFADSDDFTPLHFGDDDSPVTIETTVVNSPFHTDNVGGIIRGHGDLANEWIIIGAHYDHVGYGYFGTAPANAGTIHPGADDNGSGTSGVLLLSRLLSEAYRNLPAQANARSILLMTFSAEESGLNGSKHYVRNPTLDAEQINIMLNLDMIGRLRQNLLEVSGTGSAQDFMSFLQPHFDASGIEVINQPTGQGPSDHAPFYGVKIPVLFFFTGIHSDYHSPRDIGSKINPVGAVKITRLVQEIALDLATRAESLEFTKAPAGFSRNFLTNAIKNKEAGKEALAKADGDDEEESTAPPSRRARVRLGIEPNYGDAGPGGLPVTSVFEKSSAAEGGIKAGDIITGWNGHKITDISSLFQQLIKHEPGEVVTITVIRSEKSLDLKVVLKASGG